MIRAACIALSALCLAGPVSAQQAADPGTGAVLRVLDKVGGVAKNVELSKGTQIGVGALTVALRECRYPSGNPNRDAFAFLDVTETATAKIVFQGWMIASSPALNPMEHSRYDVWVLSCKTS